MPVGKHTTLIVVFFLLMLNTLFASTVLYDDSRGLSNNFITRIEKDRTGLLWIATQNGLNTFDGHQIKEAEAFKGFRINALAYDNEKHFLWIGSSKGLYGLSLTTNKLVDYTALIRHKDVLDLFFYEGSLYVVFFHGSIISINKDFVASPVFGIKSLGTKARYIGKNMAIDPAGNLYFSLNGMDYLVKLNLVTRSITILDDIKTKDIASLVAMPGYCIVNFQNGNSEILGNHHNKNPFFNTPGQALSTPTLLHCYNNEYYASLYNEYGIFAFNPAKTNWEPVKTDESVSFKSKIITCLFRDAHRVLWAGTNKGLIKIDLPVPTPFKILFDGYSPPVSNRNIVTRNENEFFIATYQGVYHYFLKENKAVLIDGQRVDSVFPLYTRALLYDGDYLYAGTESHSNFFYRVNLKTQTCEGYFFKTTPQNTPIGAIYSMIKDNNGVIWLATDIGLASYNSSDQIITIHTQGDFNVKGTRLFYITHAKAKGKFWVAGRNAAYLVDENKGIEKEYSSATFPKQLVPDDYLFISEDSTGKIWLGTKNSGLVVLNDKTGIAENLTRSDGLSSNEVYSILWQNDSIGWISTVNGLCRYNTSSRTFNNYFYEDGLSDNEFNQHSFLQTKNYFYFGGINGINYFNPEVISENKDKLTIFLASLVKWNQGLQDFENVNSERAILMSPKDHLLTFTFGLSDYSQTEGHCYFYRIKGLYDKWVSLGNQNILRLEGLPAGNYQVEVIGFNRAGVRSQNVLEYTIEIEQVFYKTWWFYVLLALGVVLIVYGYFKWRLRNIKLKLKLRTQIASNLHDEVGSLLTSIIISTDSARYSSSSIEEKNNKLEKISALSRAATSTMSDVLWSIDARNDYAGNLTDRMREQAEAMLIPLGIEVEFDFTATQQDQTINPDTRQQLYLIFKEAINNIAKHSHATVVKVSYKQQGKSFELIIENNNHNRGDVSAYTGQGIKNMQMRAKKIGAVPLFDQSGNSYKIIIKN